ncbi:MAG: ATP-binding protein [Pseudomonadota bacterium]|nr:ATP-binding protein [Pseudomonadota bacterium]
MLRVALVVFLVEFAIRLSVLVLMENAGFGRGPGIGLYAIAESAILVLIASPLIYVWIIRPYIDQRSTVETELRENVHYLDEAQRVARMGFWRLDLVRNDLFWSREIFRIFEIDPARFGASYEAFLATIHPGDRDRVDRAYRESLVTRAPYEITHRLRMPDGRVKWVSERCETQFGPDGAPTVSTGTVRDITDRIAVERSLDENRGMLAGILSISQEAIVVADHDLRIRLASSGVERIFGHAPEDLIGMSIENLIPEDLRTRHRAHVAAFEANGRDSLLMSARRELLGLRKNGERFPAAISLSRFQADGGTIYSLVIRDIGPEKLAHDRLVQARLDAEAASHAKSNFLANMSHELRTPLTAIIGFSEIMTHELYGPVGNRKYREYGEEILNSGRHLMGVINDILDLSRVGSENMELSEKVVDLAATVRACLFIVGAQARTSGVDLKDELPADLPDLVADLRALKQILTNLLSNAVKFTPAGGEVRVRAAPVPDGGIEIEVEDTGIGIPADRISACLMPFHSMEREFNRSFEGTGLGLPLSKSLIELHGGALDIHSQVGTGTRVTVRFPADRVMPAPAGKTAPSVDRAMPAGSGCVAGLTEEFRPSA